jgi:hypothetical protein
LARRSVPPQPKTAVLTVQGMRNGMERLQARIADLEAFDPQSVQKRWAPEVTALQTAIEETLGEVFGPDTVEYNRYSSAARLDRGPVIMRPYGPGWNDTHRSDFRDRSEAQQYLTEGKAAAILLLQQAIRGLQEKIAYSAPSPDSAKVQPAVPQSRRVFVVHGHDEGTREAVARLLERLDFKPIILHEQANQGRTIIEKVEAHGDVAFAVILLTPDDEGCAAGSTPEPRPRQNVLLELGYFIGRLGRGRVCALRRGEMELPTDSRAWSGGAF